MFVESMIVNISQPAKIENAHTTTNVNANDIGYHLVSEVAGKTNNTPCTGVNVGHNPYLLIGEHIYREQFLYLHQRIFFNIIRENLHVISFYCDGY